MDAAIALFEDEGKQDRETWQCSGWTQHAQAKIPPESELFPMTA